MMLMNSRVPMFKLRPYRGLLIAALFFAVVGGLVSAYFFMEDSYESEARRGLFSLIVTGILVLISVVAAFSRYRFSHLRHHRPGYKRG
jgi:ABC-type transport system involved in cytochrome c biogenesis permease subunit